MEPVTEVVSISLKSADVGQQLSQLLQDTLLQQPGCLRVRWSPVLEDATKARCFIDWDDISLHKQFEATPSYPLFLEKLEPFLESPPQLHHVKLQPFPSSVLNNEGGKSKTSVVEVLYMHFTGDDTLPLR